MGRAMFLPVSAAIQYSVQGQKELVQGDKELDVGTEVGREKLLDGFLGLRSGSVLRLPG